MGSTHLWMASGWHQEGDRHCFTCRFQMAVTIWIGKAQRRTAWRVLNELKGSDGDGWILMDTSLTVATRSGERSNVFGDYPRVFAVEDCNCGCVETAVKKPDDRAIPPFPKVERGDSTILPQEHLISSEQASFEFTCTSVEEAIFWDCSVDFATAFKMPERPRPNAVTKPATCAGKRQHGRRRLSSGTNDTETTVCSFRREESATFTAICEDGNRVVRDESCLSCVEPRRSQTIGSGPREARGAQERTLDSFTLVTVSRVVRERPRRGDSHPHATSVILCRRSGRTLACSVPCNSSADLLVGTTSPDHRMRNSAKSGRARSGVTWSWQTW